MKLYLLVYLFLLFFWNYWYQKIFIVILFYSYLVLWICIRIFNNHFSKEVVHSLCEDFFLSNYNLWRFSTKYWNKNILFHTMETCLILKSVLIFPIKWSKAMRTFVLMRNIMDAYQSLSGFFQRSTYVLGIRTNSFKAQTHLTDIPS